jgi:hypothetical protein
VNIRELFWTKTFPADIQLPIAAVAVRAQNQSAAALPEFVDGRRLVFDIKIGVDANAISQFNVVGIGILISEIDVFARHVCIVNEEDGLLLFKVRQIRTNAALAGDRKWRFIYAEDGKEFKKIATTGFVQLIFSRVFLVVN